MAKFNIGDRVKLINPCYFDKEVGLKNGSIGTVVAVLIPNDDEEVIISYGYAIEFDNWMWRRWGEDKSIWWVEDYKLEKVEEQK